MVRVDSSPPVDSRRSSPSDTVPVRHHRQPAEQAGTRLRQPDPRPEPEEDLNQAERAVVGWWDRLWPEAQRLVISIPLLVLVVSVVVNSGRSEDVADENTAVPTTAPAAPTTTAAAPSPDPAMPFEERGAAFVASLDSTQVAIWDQMAQCESSGDWSANTGNGYYGGLQFDPNTWAAYGGEGQPHEASREAQIMVAEQILAEQGWGAWPACSAKLGLG